MSQPDSTSDIRFINTDEDELVEAVLVEIDERLVKAVRVESEVPQVFGHAAGLHTAVALPDKSLDVGLVLGVKLVDAIELLLKSAIKTLEIVNVTHTMTMRVCCYNTESGKEVTSWIPSLPEKPAKQCLRSSHSDISRPTHQSGGQVGGVGA